MKSTRSIQLKAALLLVVFAMNTIVGFACSMGVDMGFNRSHHALEAAKGSVHIHKDGKKHLHKPVTGKHRHESKKKASKADDCCKEKVVKLQTADKNFQYTKTGVTTPVVIIAKAYADFAVLAIARPAMEEYTACHFHPPPRDIRIAIQSFQI